MSKESLWRVIPLIKYQYITVIYYLLTKCDIILSDLGNVRRYIFSLIMTTKKKKDKYVKRDMKNRRFPRLYWKKK